MRRSSEALVKVVGVDWDPLEAEPQKRFRLKVPMGGQFKGATTLASVRPRYLRRVLRGKYPGSAEQARACLAVLAPDGTIPWKAIHYDEPPKGEPQGEPRRGSGEDEMKLEITVDVEPSKPIAELRREVMTALKGLDSILVLPPGKPRRHSRRRGAEGGEDLPLVWYFEEFNPKETDGKLILKVEEGYFSSSSDQAVNDIVVENENKLLEAIAGVSGIKKVGNLKLAK